MMWNPTSLNWIRFTVAAATLFGACTGSSCGREEAALQPNGNQVQATSHVTTHGNPLPTELITIPAGLYFPLYPGKDGPKQIAMPAFSLEVTTVTNAQFLVFVQANPQWQRSQVPAVFADKNYLAHWSSNTSLEDSIANAPVTHVSWFAARAYARWIGRRLPTLAEWEHVAAASETNPLGRDEPGYTARILEWYSKPTPARLPSVGRGVANVYGVQDLHGLVWEWVEDFNSALVTGESRGDSGLDRNLFCGSSSINAADPSDYAAYMRFATRSSLRATYSIANVGFRCAQSAPNPLPPSPDVPR